MSKIFYVTSNPGKFAEAKLVLSPLNPEQIHIDIPEVQGAPNDIILEKAKSVEKLIDEPFIVEDVTFEMEALNGFPGPYIKDFLYSVNDTGLYELARKYQNFRVSTTCYAAYCGPGKSITVKTGTLSGQLVPAKGDTKHGKRSYNSVFQPEGFEKTFGQMSLEEHASISHRAKALNQIKPLLI